MEVYWSFRKTFNGLTALDYGEFLPSLGDEEKVFFEKLRFDKRRHDWLAGRMAVKELISSVEPTLIKHGKNTIQILNSNSGAPYIKTANPNSQVGMVSISHSNGYVLCAFSRENTSLGVDLELVEKRSPDFIQDFFTKEESYEINNSIDTDQAVLATLCWSTKEAYLKAMSTGLKVDTRSIEIDLKNINPIQTEWTPIRYLAKQSTNNSLHLFWRREGNFVLSACIHEGQKDCLIRI